MAIILNGNRINLTVLFNKEELNPYSRFFKQTLDYLDKQYAFNCRVHLEWKRQTVERHLKGECLYCLCGGSSLGVDCLHCHHTDSKHTADMNGHKQGRTAACCSLFIYCFFPQRIIPYAGMFWNRVYDKMCDSAKLREIALPIIYLCPTGLCPLWTLNKSTTTAL